MDALPELPLRGIHLPPSISWWPPAIGWWLLLVGLILCLWLVGWMIKSYLKPSLKKEALKELIKIEQLFQETADTSHCLSDLSIFLRRVMISQKPLEQVAGVTGTAWLKLLDQTLGFPGFSQGPGQLLLAGPYQHVNSTASDIDKDAMIQLINLCRKWVTRL